MLTRARAGCRRPSRRIGEHYFCVNVANDHLVCIASPQPHPCGHTSTPRSATGNTFALKILHRPTGLYPQLAFPQTPWLRLGVHECQFDDGGGDAGAGMSADLLPVQRRETPGQLVRLARVLEELQELVIARGPGPAGSFSVVCEHGELYAYGRKGVNRSCLPPDVWTRFARATVSDGADA